jgi:hypothetical protein
VAQRPPRIAALEREVEELHRIEEVLIAAATRAQSPRAAQATCLPSRLPTWQSR